MSGQLGNLDKCEIFSSGVEVVSHRFLPEFTQVPAKKHNRRKHKNSAYHKRIQKKWIKRFGYTQERWVFMADGKIFAHKNTVGIISDCCV